ncbi:ribose-phosphate pyrophosphokinase, partial [Nowakowskiella sp. JEL0078]
MFATDAQLSKKYIELPFFFPKLKMRNIVIFAGSSHPQLVESICFRLGIPMGNVSLRKFANKETNVEIGQSVRGVDVFIVQSAYGNINDNFMELCIMVNACKTASAQRVVAVIPCFPYARQPETPYKKNGSLSSRVPADQVHKFAVLNNLWESPVETKPNHAVISPSKDSMKDSVSISSITSNIEVDLGSSPPSTSLHTTVTRTKRVSTIVTPTPVKETTLLAPKVDRDISESTASVGTIMPGSSHDGYKHWTAKSGADHIVTLDLHDPQFQGFFNIPGDNLYSQPLLVKYIKENIPEYSKAVIVSPDAGGAKRATTIADKLGMEFALIHKDRRLGSKKEDEMMLVGEVKDKVCILVDDILDTSHTITKAADALIESGAKKVYALITHAIMSGNALELINSSHIDEVIVSNSVPQDEHQARCSKIKVFDIAPLFAEAIRRIHNGESSETLVAPIEKENSISKNANPLEFISCNSSDSGSKLESKETKLKSLDHFQQRLPTLIPMNPPNLNASKLEEMKSIDPLIKKFSDLEFEALDFMDGLLKQSKSMITVENFKKNDDSFILTNLEVIDTANNDQKLSSINVQQRNKPEDIIIDSNENFQSDSTNNEKKFNSHDSFNKQSESLQYLDFEDQLVTDVTDLSKEINPEIPKKNTGHKFISESNGNSPDTHKVHLFGVDKHENSTKKSTESILKAFHNGKIESNESFSNSDINSISLFSQHQQSILLKPNELNPVVPGLFGGTDNSGESLASWTSGARLSDLRKSWEILTSTKDLGLKIEKSQSDNLQTHSSIAQITKSSPKPLLVKAVSNSRLNNIH